MGAVSGSAIAFDSLSDRARSYLTFYQGCGCGVVATLGGRIG
jgi:hypothetical protein